MTVFTLYRNEYYAHVTHLHLSNFRRDIIITDNLSRRRVDIELGGRSLAPIYTIIDRVNAWFVVTGSVSRFIEPDTAYDFEKLTSSLRKEKPDSIVHSAEQRSAIYSIKNNRTTSCTTFRTHNGLNEILEVQQDIKQNTARDIDYLPNPQDEVEENAPIEDSLFGEGTEITKRCRQRADHSKIQCVSYWTTHTQKQQAITQH